MAMGGDAATVAPAGGAVHMQLEWVEQVPAYGISQTRLQEGIMRSFRVCVILRACPGNVVM